MYTGTQIGSADAREAIIAAGYAVDDLSYETSQTFTDPDGRDFQLHFFVNTATGKALLDPGYKIKYNNYFAP